MRQRLQKILAQAGHGSRRSAERLIAAGRVKVNGRTVTEMGAAADLDTDRVEVDGRAVAPVSQFVYLAMHKPAGVTTTASDPHGRHTVMNLLPEHLPPRVVPVGRLDRDSEGLLLFTNDGELAHRATHPSYGVDKEYLAEVRGEPGRNALRALRRGVDIGEGHRTALAEVELSPPPRSHSTREGYAWLRLVLREGRRREVRLMCAAAGHPVRTLVRTRVGPVKLGRLPTGRTRPLTQRELVALRRLAGLAPGHAAL